MNQERIKKLNKKLHVITKNHNGRNSLMVVKPSDNFEYRLYKKNNRLELESRNKNGNVSSGANGIQCYIRNSVIKQNGKTFDSGLFIKLSDIIVYGTFNELVNEYPEYFV